jgi:hypothetical protein
VWPCGRPVSYHRSDTPPRDLALLADELRADWRLARRNLGRSPLFTTVARLTLMVAKIVSEIDPSSPPFNIVPLADRLDRTFDQPRFYTIALVLFALMTLASPSSACKGCRLMPSSGG